MKTFLDSTDRQWAITIHVTAIKRLRGLLNVDLYSLIDNKFEGLGKLLSDPVQLVDVIYVLCKDDADREGITDEEFGRAMRGDAIARATEAFLSEFTDFFPDPKVREGLRKVLETTHKVRDILLSRGLREVDEIDLEDLASQVVNSNGLSGNLPAQLGSIPDRSP
jgi:hypothetical protein